MEIKYAIQHQELVLKHLQLRQAHASLKHEFDNYKKQTAATSLLTLKRKASTDGDEPCKKMKVSVPEPVEPEPEPVEPVEPEPEPVEPEEPEYFPEKILRKKNNKYLVSWQGYDASENTWETTKGQSDWFCLMVFAFNNIKKGKGVISRHTVYDYIQEHHPTLECHSGSFSKLMEGFDTDIRTTKRVGRGGRVVTVEEDVFVGIKLK